MSLSIDSSIHAVAKISHDVELVSAKKTADQSSKATSSNTKPVVLLPKPAPKLDERAQIELLSLEGHSNLQIAATVGLPVNVVALTLGDSTTESTSNSSASALVALSGRLSVSA